MAWVALGAGLSPVLTWLSSIDRIKYPPQPVVLPTGHPVTPASPISALDAALQRLDKAAWVATPTARRIQLLEQCLDGLIQRAEHIAALGVQAKGSYGLGLGEEMMLMFPCVLAIKEYVLSLKAGGQWRPQWVRPAPGAPDQLAAGVFPWGMLAALLPGWSAEVWMAPGKPATQGAVYRAKAEGNPGPGAISLILGGGNLYNLALLDVLHKLIAEDEVVVLKMSPVNAYVGPVLEEALAPLVEANALAVVYGGREVGEYLVAHPLVESVHLTGSADTCNAVVWGSPTAPRDGPPPTTKRVTAELGNVTPFIIVPGPWSAEDLARHARGVVAGLTHNASHNCCAAEVVVTAQDWPLRGAFMAALREELAKTPQRVIYYPGATAKYTGFKQRFQTAGIKVHELGVAVGAPTEGSSSPAGPPQPWLLAEGLSPDQASLQQENWSGVLQEVALQGTGDDPVAFMGAATDFCNQRVWGSLAASVWVHPATEKQHQEAVDRMIASLRYGAISVNIPGMAAFGLSCLPWGAAPGNTLANVESGIGMVHNTRLFDHAVKGVVRVPWKPATKPVLFDNNYALAHMVPTMLRLLARLDKPLAGMPYMLALTPQAVRG